MARQIGQRRVENVAADVVKINVDPFGTSLAQRLAHVFGLVVHRRIEADLGDELAALLGPPAMPTTRQPWIRAICPATIPTSPAAPETTTVWPACGLPMSRRPK